MRTYAIALLAIFLAACSSTPKGSTTALRLASISVSPTVPVRYRVAATNITQFQLVKMSTTASEVATLLHTDNGALMTGVAMESGAIGVAIPIQEPLGYQTSVISDGTGAISAGDLIDLSSTVDGDVMKAPASPTADANTVCTAVTAAVAVLGTVFQCL